MNVRIHVVPCSTACQTIIFFLVVLEKSKQKPVTNLPFVIILWLHYLLYNQRTQALVPIEVRSFYPCLQMTLTAAVSSLKLVNRAIHSLLGSLVPFLEFE